MTIHEATAYLTQRYAEQCELFPRLRQIPLARYVRRNLPAAMRLTREVTR